MRTWIPLFVHGSQTNKTTMDHLLTQQNRDWTQASKCILLITRLLGSTIVFLDMLIQATYGNKTIKNCEYKLYNKIKKKLFLTNKWSTQIFVVTYTTMISSFFLFFLNILMKYLQYTYNYLQVMNKLKYVNCPINYQYKVLAILIKEIKI